MNKIDFEEIEKIKIRVISFTIYFFFFAAGMIVVIIGLPFTCANPELYIQSSINTGKILLLGIFLLLPPLFYLKIKLNKKQGTLK